VVLGLYSKRVTTAGVFAGVVTGVFVFVALALSKHDPAMGLNAGFIALCGNVAVVAAVSLLAPAQRGGFHEHSRASIGA
jgi:SSS family solute:Na+ symporter